MVALCAKEVQIAAFKNLFVCVNVKLYYLYKKETAKKLLHQLKRQSLHTKHTYPIIISSTENVHIFRFV